MIRTYCNKNTKKLHFWRGLARTVLEEEQISCIYGILKNPVKMEDKVESECKGVRVRLGLG
jgi:hypothetical protein